MWFQPRQRRTVLCEWVYTHTDTDAPVRVDRPVTGVAAESAIEPPSVCPNR
jgi:hypothetical protein